MSDDSKVPTARELAEKVVSEMTSKAMTGPRFAVPGWRGEAAIYVDAVTALVERDRTATIEACAREAEAYDAAPLSERHITTAARIRVLSGAARKAT